MEPNVEKEAAKQQRGRSRILGYISIFPMILILIGGSILGFGWFRHAETPQTIGAVIAGIGLVALLSRFLRGPCLTKSKSG